MKKYLIILSLFLFAGMKAKADTADSLGLPGDNLDLAGVLDIFKTSTSLDDFEKKLNDPANEVNNLDLNNDGNVDYIRVVDQVSGDDHAIVLQVPVSETESQDVAVIEVEKKGTESAELQISGDEELYGENYFVEPTDDNATPTTDQKWQGFRPAVVFVNVWLWPSVRFVYAPAYVVWVSPYRWNYYPVYWHPWHPVAWRVHYGRVVRYHHHCAYVHECRVQQAHNYYGPHRMASPAVHGRYAADHERHAARTAGSNGKAVGSLNAQKSNGGKQGKAGTNAGKQQAPKNGGGNKAGRQGGGGKQGAAKQGGGKQQGPRGGGGHKGGGGGGHQGGGGKRR